MIVPVADLKGGPVEPLCGKFHDDLRETQLLLNEVLLCVGEEKKWFFVEAQEQEKLTPRGLRVGYPGWVNKKAVIPVAEPLITNAITVRGTVVVTDLSGVTTGVTHLSAGTRLCLTGERRDGFAEVTLLGAAKGWIEEHDVLGTNVLLGIGKQRRQIIETALSFAGTPYLWGGRSTHLPSPHHVTSQKSNHNPKTLGDGNATATGIDCSGLTQISYRVGGIDIPRNAYDQWKVSQWVDPGELEPADLIFLSNEGHQGTIAHVMIYLGNEELIGAEATGSVVTVTTFSKKFGHKRDDILYNNSSASLGKIYCGSFIGAK